MADDLYERDFYLWTQGQAKALRSHAGASNALDYDRLAEEVEDLGRSEHSRAASHVFRIIQHLYELDATRNDRVIGHWRGEIGTFRVDAAYALTRAIRNMIEAELDDLHRKAAKVAQDRMRAHEPEVVIDASRRWTLAQILGEADDPLEAGLGETDAGRA